MNNLILIFFIILIPIFTLSQTIEDQVIEIGNELLCPVCQGQSVAESNSGLAQDMRAIIKEKLEKGESKEEIIDYFVSRYGDSILGAPPAKGIGIILWLLPLLSLSIGAFIIYKSITSFKNPANKPDIATDTEGDKYLKKLDDELNKD